MSAAEDQLIEEVSRYSDDPNGYAEFAFPWGEGELADATGPRAWQSDIHCVIRDHLRSPDRFMPLLIAVASGHGIGKSALISQIITWGMSTCVDTRIVVTANTDTQLRTKTWPEVMKWMRLSINAHWFTTTATAVHSSDPEHTRTWRADAIPWSDNNTEAFAGLHNKKKRIIVIFDEASSISDKIWEVTEGALTDENTEIIWIAFGNPTRNTGRFRECFGRHRHRWITRQIDSRTVEGTNKKKLDQWVEDYGEDSDFVRVRVRGLFPRASNLQFIPTDLVAEAMKREPRANLDDPLIMMLDIARGGDDNNVFRFRRGLDAKSIKPIRIPGSETKDSMRLVSKAVELLNYYKPHYFFYDGTGVGGPVGDRIKQLGYNVIEVQFGSKANDPKYGNKRAEMWQKGKEWMERGGAIDNDPVLEQDLTGPEYFHDKRDRLFLESKEDMKDRGLASPDDGDALMMSFAIEVAPVSSPYGGDVIGKATSDYNPYADDRL